MTRQEWLVLAVCSAVSLCTIRLVEQTGEPEANPYRISPSSTIDMTNGDEPLP
jgi:hypothetical protein